MTRRSIIVLPLTLALAGFGGLGAAWAQTDQPASRPVTLEQCSQTALLQNHALQIQRLNPEIARETLSGSRGYYDPVFTADVRRESSSEESPRDRPSRLEVEPSNRAASAGRWRGLRWYNS